MPAPGAHSPSYVRLTGTEGGEFVTHLAHHVDQTRGEVRAVKVLVNYGVFREGFDAPRTRVVIVARPVYSPNLYFQMIGRGRRGPKNGGTDRCLIINVQDNIDNFERKLAFSDLDWLWA